MTDIFLYNSNFQVSNIIDTYQSLIWSIKANEPGNFELYLPKTNDYLKMFGNPFENDTNMYIAIPDIFSYFEYFPMMIIETMEYSDSDNTIKLSGRSLESLLDRRIIWGQQSYTANESVLHVICDILNKNVVSPVNASRAINNFSLRVTNNDSITIGDAIQYEGASLLDTIYELCEKYGFIYKILIMDDPNLDIQFMLDEPYDFTDTTVPSYFNPIFSTELDNFYNVRYVESTNTLKTSALVSGLRYSDDEIGKLHQTEEVNYGGTKTSGIYRREMYIDASNIQYEDDPNPGDIFGTTSYSSFLVDRGKTELQNNKKTVALEGDIKITNTNWWRLIGSTVIINGGNENMIRKARIKELVYSISDSGETLVPTFDTLDEVVSS